MIVFFTAATLITGVLFEKFLIHILCNWVNICSRQRNIMDISLSDIIEACRTIDAECMGLLVSQYYLL